MKRIVLEVNESVIDKFMWLLKHFSRDEVEIVDDDTLFTREDNAAYEKAKKELERGEAISLEELKKELSN